MNLEQGIKGRRSVRKYSDQEITTETLEKIVDVARFAPSWKNTQIVRYHVIKNKEVKKNIGENCVLDYVFNCKTITRCDALAVVTVEKGISGYEKDGSFTTSQGDAWENFDAGIGTQTFCLAAHNEGVATVILGVFDEEKIREYVDFPENEKVSAIVAMGYPEGEIKAGPPRKEVEELLTIVL